jgi:hypothetical protein|tara:strand:- start:1247 stop:1627 length:381 start_codon:yes stop_codon:yes gene_type:complete
MDLAYYVTQNQELIDDIKSRTPGQADVDMYYGTLDYATARFHTILIQISQDRLLEQIHRKDVLECFDTIQDFYKNVQRYRFWPSVTRFITKRIIHRIGTKRIPAIKNLLNRLENNNKFYHHGDDTV